MKRFIEGEDRNQSTLSLNLMFLHSLGQEETFRSMIK